MAIHVQADGRIDGGTKVGDGSGDPKQLAGFEPPEDGPEDLVAEGVDFLEEPFASFGYPNQDDPPIRGHAIPLDQAAFLHPVDEAGGVRIRHVQDIGQLAHRHVAVALDRT